VKVFLGLHKTVDDQWTSSGMFLRESEGVLCRLDDGSAVAVTHDGRVMRFDMAGRSMPLQSSSLPSSGGD
jgi:hypothetical protein